jgi:hypothetical protein
MRKLKMISIVFYMIAIIFLAISLFDIDKLFNYIGFGALMVASILVIFINISSKNIKK